MSNEKLSRRNVVTAGAWSVPVVALAAATPAAAASTGTHEGEPYYSGAGRLTFDATYANNGTETLPAGSEITFQLPFDGIWTTFDIDANPGGVSLTSLGSVQVDLGDGAKGRRWSYRLDESLAAGNSIDLTFGAFLTSTHTTASNSLKARVKTQFLVGSAMANDLTNNSLSNSGYAYFNNASAEA